MEPPSEFILCYFHLIPCVYSTLTLATSVFCSFSNFRYLFLSASALRVLQSKLEVWGTLSLALRVFLGKSSDIAIFSHLGVLLLLSGRLDRHRNPQV